MSDCVDIISKVVLGKHIISSDMMIEWKNQLASQKLLFFTKPSDFDDCLTKILSNFDAEYAISSNDTKKSCFSFILELLESLYSPVELSYNLKNSDLHGEILLDDDTLRKVIDHLTICLSKWSSVNPDVERSVLDEIKIYDLAVNKGDNIFIEWANRFASSNQIDPYDNHTNYINCFKNLYDLDNYYTSMFFAWRNKSTDTQFFNDYGLHAARCRRLGSLGGTTNPAIAIMGEDDLDGISNIHGENASELIKSKLNKWKLLRDHIAKTQSVNNTDNEWAASQFTEYVVSDAMLQLRSIFLHMGLGRVAYQIRPDWHLQEEKLIDTASEVYESLSTRFKLFDDFLLFNADDIYKQISSQRIGKPNVHFKISCTSPVALDVVKALNAGYHPKYPDKIKDRMYTNMTLVFDVSQMILSSLAIEEGIKDYQLRTGITVDDGSGGSAVASMIGRFNDAIRVYRVASLIKALPDSSKYKNIDPVTIKSLNQKPLNTEDFINEMKSAEIVFVPEDEEESIDHAGTLVTKIAYSYLQNICGLNHIRLLTASKRNFNQNTDLIGVPYSTDFGNIQRMSLDINTNGIAFFNRKSIYDGITADGKTVEGSIWHKYDRVLNNIWPDWKKASKPGCVKPEEFINTIYVPPTLTQFTNYWYENVRRAGEHYTSLVCDK